MSLRGALRAGGRATRQSIPTAPAIFANSNCGEAAKLPKNRFEQKWVKSTHLETG